MQLHFKLYFCKFDDCCIDGKSLWAIVQRGNGYGIAESVHYPPDIVCLDMARTVMQTIADKQTDCNYRFEIYPVRSDL